VSEICPKCGEAFPVTKCAGCGGEMSLPTHCEPFGRQYHNECLPPHKPGDMYIANNVISYVCPDDDWPDVIGETEAIQ
jgi:hypothetical protein